MIWFHRVTIVAMYLVCHCGCFSTKKSSLLQVKQLVAFALPRNPGQTKKRIAVAGPVRMVKTKAFHSLIPNFVFEFRGGSEGSSVLSAGRVNSSSDNNATIDHPTDDGEGSWDSTNRSLVTESLSEQSLSHPTCHNCPDTANNYNDLENLNSISVIKDELPSLSRKNKGRNNQKYYLIWSNGSWQTLLVISVVISALHLYMASYLRQHNLVIDWRNMHKIYPASFRRTMTALTRVVIPLLAGSCCIVQLAVNLIWAAGCVGFNTILGPIRPLFLSLLLYITVVRRADVTLLTHVGRWSMALLPELVHLWNTFCHKQLQRHQQQIRRLYYNQKQQQHRNLSTLFTSDSPSLVASDRDDNDNADTSSAPLHAHSNSNIDNNRNTIDHKTIDSPLSEVAFKVTVKLDVPTMGCVACINKIDSALRQAVPKESLAIVFSELKKNSKQNGSDVGGGSGGDAFVEFICHSKDEASRIIQSLQHAIDKAGFGDNLTVESFSLEQIDPKTATI